MKNKLLLEDTFNVLMEGPTWEASSKEMGAALKGISGAERLALEDILKSKSIQVLDKKGLNGLRITTVEDLQKALEKGKVSEGPLGIIRNGLMRNPRTSEALMNKLISDWSKVSKIQAAYAGKTVKQITNELTHLKEPYPIQQAEKMANELVRNRTSAGGVAPTGPSRTSRVASTVGQGVKTAAVAGANLTGKALAKIYRLGRRFPKMTGLALLGAAGYYKLYGENPPADAKPVVTPKCITDLWDDDSVTIQTQQDGSIITFVPKTGVQQYDTRGGLKFYSNGRVFSGDNVLRGSWTPKTNEIVPLTEAMGGGNELSQEQMAKLVADANSDLTGWVSAYNLKNLLSYITQLKGKTYKGKNALQEFLRLYQIDEGTDMLSAVKKVGVRSLGVDGIEAKEELIQSLSNINTIAANSGGDGNIKTGIDNFNINWDKQPTATPTSNTTTQPATPVAAQQTPANQNSNANYHDCSNDPFPHKFGCISPQVAAVQKALQAKSQETGETFTDDQLKGYFGPKTYRALKALGYQPDNGITDGLYSDFVPSNTVQNQQPNTQSQPTPQPPPEPVTSPNGNDVA